jgi:hypothetical protein
MIAELGVAGLVTRPLMPRSPLLIPQNRSGGLPQKVFLRMNDILGARESALPKPATAATRLMSAASAAKYLGIKEGALMETERLPEPLYVFGKTFFWAREIEALVGRGEEHA